MFVLSALALLPGLGTENVWSKDEARDGLVARDMIESGRWLIPHLGGRVYHYKPPLFHWLVAAVSPRGVTEWTLRLPSVLAAAATVALTYAIGARLGPPLAGLVAAAALLSSVTFVEWARTGRLEMLLVAWLMLAFWNAVRWLEEGRRRHAVVLGLALGLGCLTKGPVGLAPLGILLVALALLGRWPRRAMADLALALALGVALPAAWLTLAAVTHAGVGEYLGAVVGRFAVEVQVTRDQHPLFALEAIGVGFLPWTPVLLGALVILARKWRTSWRRLVVPLLWAGFIVVTFTVFISPRTVYFLPIFPPLALLLGWAWTVSAGEGRRWMLYPLAATVVVFILVGVDLTIWPLTIGWHRQLTVLSRGFGAATAVVAAAAGIALLALVRRRWTDVAPLVMAAPALVVLLMIHLVVSAPRSNLAYPTRAVAARFEALVPPGAEVFFVDRRLITALMFSMRRPYIDLVENPTILDVFQHPGRYYVVPHEAMLAVWSDCPPPPPLGDETMLGGRYVLFDGRHPSCRELRVNW